jgi:hypothetical protein
VAVALQLWPRPKRKRDGDEYQRDEVLSLLKKGAKALGMKVSTKDAKYSDETTEAVNDNSLTRAGGEKSCACKLHALLVHGGNEVLARLMAANCPQTGDGEGEYEELEHARLHPQRFQGQTGKLDDRYVC